MLSLLGSGGATASGDAVDVDALRWLAPGADPVAALTRLPGECLTRPEDPVAATSIALGRIAFRSPRLLGGLAARTGMSCDSCHRDGHDHPAFHLDAVSDAPGTADVTGGVFSRVRDDGRFNPVTIPSLVDVGTKTELGSVRPATGLRAFVRAVVAEEFQGRMPSAAVEQGLLDYLGALHRSACPEPTGVASPLDRDLDEVRSGLRLLEAAIDADDRATADFLLVSLRATLGRIDQRFPADAETRRALVGLSRRLASMRATDPTGAIAGTEQERAAVVDAFEDLEARLRARAARSLYDPAYARRALGAASAASER